MIHNVYTTEQEMFDLRQWGLQADLRCEQLEQQRDQEKLQREQVEQERDQEKKQRVKAEQKSDYLALKLARSLLAHGESMDVILNETGLQETQIRELKK